MRHSETFLHNSISEPLCLVICIFNPLSYFPSTPGYSLFDTYFPSFHHKIGLKCLAHCASCPGVHISLLRTLCVGTAVAALVFIALSHKLEWCKCISTSACLFTLVCVQLAVKQGIVNCQKLVIYHNLIWKMT